MIWKSSWVTLLFWCWLGSFNLWAQVRDQDQVWGSSKGEWVEKTYERLTTRERIGQLFMVAAYSAGKDANPSVIRKLLESHQIGGIIFMQGNAQDQARLTNEFQSMAQVPLLIGMDAEWGLGMRLTGIQDLPRQMMIGATQDTSLAYAMGQAVAIQCQRLGVHLNFAPVIDVNNNPNNPIINARSFGENKESVSRLGLSYMRGMQDRGILACAKHFPGHGDTDKDSHKDLPTIRKTREDLEALELYPFQRLIDGGVKAVMVAHLEVPALEKQPGLPTTLSKSTISGLLKEQMGFQGLVITDALNMQGVAKYFPPGEVDLRAYQAGNDILLFSQDVPVAISKIEEALREGEIDARELERRVKKILSAKYEVGLHQWEPLNLEGITQDINRATPAIRNRMASAALTLAWDPKDVLGEWRTHQGSRLYVGVNSEGEEPLYRELKKRWPGLEAIWLPKQAGPEQIARALSRVKQVDIALVGVHHLRFYPSGGRYGLPAAQMNFLKQLQTQDQVMVALMGNPYLLKELCKLPAVLVSYEGEESEQMAMARVLKDEAEPRGTLPVSPCPKMPAKRTGAVQRPNQLPSGLKPVEFLEDLDLANPRALDSMRMFIQRCIAGGAFPGAQVVAVYKGQVMVDEHLGYQTFDKQKRIEAETLYDLASLTKILSTNLAIMRLYEAGKLGMEDSLGTFLTWTRGTNKGPLKIGDLLRHEAGLRAWIPFYKATLDGKYPDPQIYRSAPTDAFDIPVAKDLYMKKDYVDTIWKVILESPLSNKGKYVYSDLDYFFLAALVEEITQQSLYAFVYRAFYQPMGLTRMGYRPLSRFEISDIAPTERDIYFRHQLIQGFVHDQAAAMLGGIAGHAGLFSNAREVAVIMQMLLQKGVYQGKQYYKPETIDIFTKYHSRISRRALGFDKPNPDSKDGGPASPYSSGHSFGHQGFTGTCTWADPQHQLVFVFLANRVYPSADNKNIYRFNARIEVQNYVYRALGLKPNTHRKQVRDQQLASR